MARRGRRPTVVLESTGVYWIPLFELLESRGFEVFLIEPGPGQPVGARPKTDRLDCQWLQRLHTYGLLRPSFRPPDAVVALRGYWRQRQMLVRYASHHVQHMQKALEQMNVKLAEVVSSIVGVTGMAIIKAILAGERDPAELAELRTREAAAHRGGDRQALDGNWRPEHLFALKQAFELYQFLHRQIDDAIDRSTPIWIACPTAPGQALGVAAAASQTKDNEPVRRPEAAHGTWEST